MAEEHLPYSAGSADLAERCKEVLDWHKTGLLNGGKGGRLRALADQIEASGMPDHYALTLAEKQTADEAMAVIATRAPAQAVAVRNATIEECARITAAPFGLAYTAQRNKEVARAVADQIGAIRALASQPPAALVETKRCEVCDWPLAESREKGCVPGDCSYRPDDPAEQRRISERRAQLRARSSADTDQREYLAAVLLSMWKEGKSPLNIVDAILARLTPTEPQGAPK